MSRNKRVGIAIGLLIFVAVISVGVFIFSPKKILAGEEKATVSYLAYEDKEIAVDEDKVITILEKYNAQRSMKTFFPYSTDDVKIQMIITDGEKTKHILLGELNIWYEASKTYAYEIDDAEKLIEELEKEFKE